MTARPSERTMPTTTRPRPTSSSTEFRLAWIVPVVGGLLAAGLELADKLPAWAKTPLVLVSAMAMVTLIACAYIVSRGLAKHEPRGRMGGPSGGGAYPPAHRPQE